VQKNKKEITEYYSTKKNSKHVCFARKIDGLTNKEQTSPSPLSAILQPISSDFLYFLVRIYVLKFIGSGTKFEAETGQNETAHVTLPFYSFWCIYIYTNFLFYQLVMKLPTTWTCVPLVSLQFN
jgi:hypothetical protein